MRSGVATLIGTAAVGALLFAALPGVVHGGDASGEQKAWLYVGTYTGKNSKGI